jgi:predicted glutamine amidotransferase
MCRLLGYLGTPVLLQNFLYESDSSLLKQTVAPQMLGMLNLAGFGVVAWDKQSCKPDMPFTYRSTQVAVFDRNLQALSRKVRTNALVAHVRGVPSDTYAQISEQNLHPFIFEGLRLAVAHNGDLASFPQMRFDLLAHIRPEVARCIQGSTDSEWIYALIVSALPDPCAPLQPADILRGIASALAAIRSVRDRHGIRRDSSVNLVACDGINLVATRFVFDFGCYDESSLQNGGEYLSQWYTLGHDYGYHDAEWKMIGGAGSADSVLVASEPLTRDISTWIEVPEYSALTVCERGGRREAQIVPLDA